MPRRGCRAHASRQNFVRVPLLCEEPLPVLREILLDGVASDDRIERRLGRVFRGPEQSPEALRFFLTRPEGA